MGNVTNNFMNDATNAVTNVVTNDVTNPSGAVDSIFTQLKSSPDAATRGYIGGWVWVFHGAVSNDNENIKAL